MMPFNEDPPIAIRSGLPQDVPFVMDTFLYGLHKSSPYNFIPNAIYFPFQSQLISKLLQTSTLTVATIEDDSETILGYALTEPYTSNNLILHWAHTKAVFRNQGIQKALFKHLSNNEPMNLVCSHFFPLFPKLRQKYCLIYDPTILQGINEK